MDAESDRVEWGPDMLDQLETSGNRMAQRRAAFVLQCECLAEGLRSVSAAEWPAVGGTAHADDIAATSIRIAGVEESVAELIRYEVGVHLRSAADHLRGFASLIEAQSSFLGGVTVGRGYFEACVWTAGLVDDQLTADQRAQRGLTRRLARLSATSRVRNQQANLFNNVSTGQPGEEDPAAATQSILDYAAERQWKVIPGRFAPAIGTKLSIEGLIKEMPGDRGKAGTYSWTKGSSVNHVEHSADVMTWLDLFVDIGNKNPPGWLTVLHSPGVLIGTILMLDSFGRYLGRTVLDGQRASIVETWLAASG